MELVNENFKQYVRYLPTRPLSEQNVIGMFHWHSLYKFDAGEVLPVTHGLFEQGFVRSAEIAVNFIRNHAVVPHPLFPSSCCSVHPSPPVVLCHHFRIYHFIRSTCRFDHLMFERLLQGVSMFRMMGFVRFSLFFLMSWRFVMHTTSLAFFMGVVVMMESQFVVVNCSVPFIFTDVRAVFEK